MNKRSAMLMAAGLVLTLIVGGVAMSVGLTGPTPSEAAPRSGSGGGTPAPIVRIEKRTVTVHERGAARSTAASSEPVGSVVATDDDDWGHDDGDEHGRRQDDDHSGHDEHDDHGGDSGHHDGDGDHGDDDRAAE